MSVQKIVRVCIDVDCPNCGWPERWAEWDEVAFFSPVTFGCGKCDYRSRERHL
ncbi:hypothetical protein [Rhodococcoides fascians]|uniref:hypothetical protein n=1 Tax=Rhodococcoides fascians TaxID=1828 RepID=UPI000A6894C6|nr:hypothetical protein [Rhodococcus fascians]